MILASVLRLLDQSVREGAAGLVPAPATESEFALILTQVEGGAGGDTAPQTRNGAAAPGGATALARRAFAEALRALEDRAGPAPGHVDVFE